MSVALALATVACTSLKSSGPKAADGGVDAAVDGTSGIGGSGGADATDAGDAAVAQAACLGHEGQTVCATGEMHACDSAGLSVSSTTCASAAHCRAGLATGACAACIEGEFHCTGAVLEHCVDNAFAALKTCDTEQLCNEVAGDCTTAACAMDQYVCQNDVLMRCNHDQSALMEVESCLAGLCDRAGSECDACSAGVRDCDGSHVRECSANGQQVTRTACPASAPHCIGQGTCVECSADSHCAPGYCVSNECVDCRETDDCTAGTCESASCNNGACTTAVTEGVACGSGNICDDAGDCVECRNHADCEARDDGGRFCTTGPTCVACRTADDCPTAACRTATCTAGVCGQTTVTSGTCGTGSVCNLQGNCEVACGNNRFDSEVEECDPTASQFDQYTCDPECQPRTIWTDCSNGQGCIGQTQCVTLQGADVAYCSPSCDSGEIDPRCNQLLPGSALPNAGNCFGGECFITCDIDIACPSTMRCADSGVCVSR